jgi:hypothetical protein
VRSEGFYVNEKSTGIEPATFRFVAQHLNHCATVVPCYLTEGSKLTRKLQLQISTVNYSGKMQETLFILRSVKGKTIPAQAWTGLEGFQEVEAPRFQDSHT